MLVFKLADSGDSILQSLIGYFRQCLCRDAVILQALGTDPQTFTQNISRHDKFSGAINRIDGQQTTLAQIKHRKTPTRNFTAHHCLVVAAINTGRLQF